MKITCAAKLLLGASLFLIFAWSITANASDYHKHHKHYKPVVKVIDKTKTIHKTEVIDKTVTIDNTVTEYVDNSVIREFTVDNTITQNHYSTEYYENTFDDNRLSGGVAAAMAHAGIPDVHGSNTGIGASISTYRGINALAIGVVHHLPSDPLTIQATLSVDDYAQDVSGVVGATFGF